MNEKLIEFTRDYDSTIIKIADILKKSESHEIILRQQNRLQKELLQSQKIEFEMYKADFKRKPTAEEKEDKIKRIMEKKYEEREKLWIKQIEKMMRGRLGKENL